MGTGVQEDIDLIIPASGYDHLLLAHTGANEVAGTGNLALMPNEQPHAAEDLLQFLLVNVWVTEEGGPDCPVVVVDHVSHGKVCGDGSCRHSWGLLLLNDVSL